jgi:nucleoside-diphosphate-sugar epimerase
MSSFEFCIVGWSAITEKLLEKFTSNANSVLLISSLNSHEDRFIGNKKLTVESRENFLERKHMPFCGDVLIASKPFMWAKPDAMSAILGKFNQNVPNRIIYLSSGAVYGNTSQPATENDQKLPINPYGFFKSQEEETLIKLFRDQTNLKILRVSNIYGNSKFNDTVNLILNSIKSNEVFPLYGLGLLERDFLHINDLISALETILSGTLSQEEIVNISSGTATPTYKLLDFIEEGCGKRPKIRNYPILPQMAFSSVLNSDLIKQRSSWAPSDLRTLLAAYTRESLIAGERD